MDEACSLAKKYTSSLYACQYGNFIGNCKERLEMRFLVWDVITTMHRGMPPKQSVLRQLCPHTRRQVKEREP
ncbi:hypothetical protein cypCar_00036165 [Cyprinus carpio]|nr:hypothetical protein cypCar_00036165 [Cyprinus carpio]